MLPSILLQLVLILLNAFFASSEMAFVSVNLNKLKAKADDGNKKAQQLYGLAKEPGKFLATIQIGITLAGFLASAFAADTYSDSIVAFLLNIGITLAAGTLKTISTILVTVILSFVMLVFGELVPKRIAMKYPERLAGTFAKPIMIISKFAYPFVKILTMTTNGVSRLLGVSQSDDREMVTEEELRIMIDASEEKGEIEDYEKEMINNVFEFNDMTADDLMTHRSKVVAISENAQPSEFLRLIVEEKYSRYPIYRNNIDDIIGVVHIKDLMLLTVAGSNKTIKDVMRKPYFVPEGKQAYTLLREMKVSKNHMAIVVDEYGLTAGIITMENLIEEIVGRIYDEHDTVDFLMQKIEENTYLVNGMLPIEDVNEMLDLKLPEDEYDTFAGFIIGLLGFIPADGEKPQTTYENLSIFVEQVKNKTINLVKVIISNNESDTAGTDKDREKDKDNDRDRQSQSEKEAAQF